MNIGLGMATYKWAAAYFGWGRRAMASTGVESQPSGAGKSEISEVRVYPHSPILYWWIVWAYGFSARC